MSITLEQFVTESNAIEGIHRSPLEAEIEATKVLIGQEHLTVAAVVEFVRNTAGAELRSKPGMDVYVGNHVPPPGGPAIEPALAKLLEEIDDMAVSPFKAHVEYETLHPFMDGNGRSGRAIWAAGMRQIGLNPFSLPFLHRFYYQVLDESR